LRPLDGLDERQADAHTLVWEYMEHVVLSSAAAGTVVWDIRGQGRKAHQVMGTECSQES
jgi:hypothetical protein